LIYHTDCMMTLLSDHAVICAAAITKEEDRKKVLKELTDPSLNTKPYQILELDLTEIEGMCANMFNLLDRDGRNTLVMSDRARRTFRPDNITELQKHYKVVVANIDMIEHVGGGSARCMLAERF
jgi:hypothetical protein